MDLLKAVRIMWVFVVIAHVGMGYVLVTLINHIHGWLGMVVMAALVYVCWSFIDVVSDFRLAWPKKPKKENV